VLAAQAPIDLGHEVFRQPQVIKGLLEGLGGVLRLAAVTFKALPRCEAAAVSGFGMFFWRIVWLGTWCAPVLRGGLLWLQSAQAHATHAPSHL
jgi:hypothetical protein